MKRLLYISLVFISYLSVAQTEISIQADTNQTLIGDIINVELRVETSDQIIWPSLKEAISPLELQHQNEIDSSYHRGKQVFTQNFTVQQFDTGYFVLPSLPFITTSGDTFHSDSLSFSFLSVPLDTTKKVFDIKAPMAVPFNFEEAKPYIYSLLGIIALVILIYFLIQKMSNKVITDEEVIITIPCHTEAIDSLRKLESENLCEKGLVKEHYVRLTDILRKYFDREFKIDTLESTTDETLDLLNNTKIDKPILDEISTLLVEADLVKFAKSNPGDKTNEGFMRKSYRIVENCHHFMKEEADV